MPVGTIQTILVCSQAVTPCPPEHQQTITAFLLDPSAAGSIQLVLDQGGVDWAAVQDVFLSALALYGVGIGVGLIINVVRKLKG